MSHHTVMESKGTRRFFAFVLSTVGLAGLTVLAMYIGAPSELMWPFALFAAGYQGFGMAHDGYVRGKEMAAAPAVEPATAKEAPK